MKYADKLSLLLKGVKMDEIRSLEEQEASEKIAEADQTDQDQQDQVIHVFPCSFYRLSPSPHLRQVPLLFAQFPSRSQVSQAVGYHGRSRASNKVPRIRAFSSSS